MRRIHCAIVCLLAFLSTAAAQDPWVVSTDSPLDGDYYGITSANGQIGILSSRKPLQASQVIVGGLYDVFGRDQVESTFPNINPLLLTLRMNGLLVSEQNISNYRQSLDFRNAVFSGQFDVESLAHVEYQIVALRQLPFGYMMDVTIRPAKDIRLEVTNTHALSDRLHGMQTNFQTIKNQSRSGAEKQLRYSLLSTQAFSPAERWQVAATTAFIFPDLTGGAPNVPIQQAIDSANQQHSQSFSQTLSEGTVLHFALVGSILGSNVAKEVSNEAERLTIFQILEGYNQLWSLHRAAWQDLWQSDIVLDGPAQDQQDIHNMLYHLYAFNREGSRLSCSPMGLSGTGYHGHIFWDADTWMYPVLAVMHPEIAVEMLHYRLDRLEAAQRNAYLHGFKGAMYAWESAETGVEQTASRHLYPAAEVHITGDVALACWQHYLLTNDKHWLQEAWPVLAATADFWASRVTWQPDGRASLKNVIGADEWTCNTLGGKNVDNNAYTIGVAKANLKAAMQAAKMLGKDAPATWQQTVNGLQLSYMDNGVIAEHDTYDGHVIKQADVILLAYPLHEVTDPDQIRRDLEYYKQKTPEKKTPAMSKSIYACLYSRLGDSDQALHYFRDSYLNNLNPPFRVMAEFNGGTNPYFLTGAAGTLQSLLFGFAGLDITDMGLRQVYPVVLPQEWRSLTIRLRGRNDFIIRQHK